MDSVVFNRREHKRKTVLRFGSGDGRKEWNESVGYSGITIL